MFSGQKIDWTKQAWIERDECENWLRSHVQDFVAPIVDIGVNKGISIDRGWMENVGDYKTLSIDGTPDILADMTEIDKIESLWSIANTVVCTWVFEHCNAPYLGMNGIQLMLKEGGNTFIVVPFCWKYHAPPDYWRFTEEAMKILCKRSMLKIKEIKWTKSKLNIMVMAEK